MRSFIIGLSILLFLLSGLILFRAFSLPEGYSDYHSRVAAPVKRDLSPVQVQPEQQPEPEPQPVQEKTDNQELLQNLQDKIAKLENELASKNKRSDTKDEPEVKESKTKVLAVLGAGAFRSGQITVEEGLMNEVKDLVPVILTSPDERVIIEGHTDSLPIKESMDRRYSDNMELSFLRAKAVALILEKNGVPLDRISVIGYGDTRPVASNDTPQGRLENRRVEVKLVPGDREF